VTTPHNGRDQWRRRLEDGVQAAVARHASAQERLRDLCSFASTFSPADIAQARIAAKHGDVQAKSIADRADSASGATARAYTDASHLHLEMLRKRDELVEFLAAHYRDEFTENEHATCLKTPS
jgi:hypothetical protein